MRLSSLVLGAALLAGSASAAETPPAAELLKAFGGSVFAVEYRLRLAEPPRGSEGPSETRAATAVLVDEGLLITSGDPVPEADAGPRALVPVEWEILLPGGGRLPATLVGADRSKNLAFLRADSTGLGGARPVDLAGAGTARVGDRVLVLSPLPPALGGTIAYRRNEVVAVDEEEAFAALDAPLDDLEIGGLVVREDGAVLGLVGERLPEGGTPTIKPFGLLRLLGSSQQGPVGGYPVLLTAAGVAPLVASPPPLTGNGDAPRGWLGVTMQPLSEELAEYWGIEGPGGVVLGYVVEGSPAARAGLAIGDVITELAGSPLPIRTQRELPEVRRRVLRAGAGATIEIAYWREGERRQTFVKLSASPATQATAERYESERFGLTVRELTYDVRQRLNLPPEKRGVLVETVTRGGWASIAGLRTGDLVLRVEDRETPDPGSFRGALEDAEAEEAPEVLLFLQRNFRTFFLPVATEWKR